ncbi:hypothetical protein TSAR_003947 [Trichomalopsis sarcophagae]|uniref:DDE Tnp4 domain-containing protein n=1 Tax=Trichomalopsis sarcophagae TaxID=543379 RepID=A0A232EKM5_9HYME|nr:hypothetical protein TSAR_003947 [Trichomalopsis sarcophagae]
MIAATTNGFIIDVYGPYSGDIFIVDRGFRDVIPKLENNGYTARMPYFLDKNKKQLTFEQANKSRIVTKLRFVIEVVNGILKSKFRIFDHVWFNKSIPHLMQDFKIACAIYNSYFNRIESDKDNCDVIAAAMLRDITKPNLLQNLIDETNLLKKRKVFSTMNADTIPEFPILSWNNLYNIALGSYQIKQAVSYYGEHINTDGKYEIKVHNDTENIDFQKYKITIGRPLFIRVQLLSRHSKQIRYSAFILLDLNKTQKESVQHWYCQCYGRHLQDIREPATFLNNYFLNDHVALDSDESDQES